MGAPIKNATVVAVGDLQLGDSHICEGFGFRSRWQTGEDLLTALEAVRPALTDADLVFGNLEVTLSENGADWGRLDSAQMRGRPDYAAALRRTGFSVLNVANNHAVQHGDTAFHETVELIEAQGIACCGVRGDDGWCARPVRLVTAGGVRIGVLGYSRRPRQYGSGPTPYAQGPDENIRADVTRLRPEVDHVVVSLHWGEEFVTQPSAGEVAFARSLVAAGANLVLGHHPHVARPVEQVDSALVAYSLGNFVGDMIWSDVLRDGLILRCRLDASGTYPVSVAPTFVQGDFRPSLRSGDVPVVRSAIQGLEDGAYQQEMRRTLRQQQIASYRYALANLHRYRPAKLFQLVAGTIRNKVYGG